MTDIGLAIAQLQRQVAELQRQSRLSSASLDDTALVVRDGDGSLRGIVGQQGDGTTAVNIVNGPPPPAPSTPVVASVLGGISAGWDGTFADGAVIPMDWARIEVHASPDTEFTPTATTLQATVETAQGATVVIPTDDPLYVRLVARSTSGTASTPSAQAGPYGPTEVVATDILDGIVTTLKLADDAVTSAKLAVAAVDTTALADGAVLTEKLADAAVAVGKLADNAVTGPAIAADAVTAGKISADAVTAREIAAGSVTTAEVAAGAITTDKLTVTGGTNILADPSFEGPATEALVASVSFWSVDPTKGNASSKSLLVDATAGAVTNRQITLATIAVIPGDQVYLAFDYQTSPDYNGTRVRFYARWHDAAGGTLGYTIADSGAPPVIGGTGWSRPTATGTAPPDATRADIVALSLGASVGSVWFDNAVLRTVVGGTQIQDGAITTTKIVAGAVQTAQLDAEAVNASKIAAGAVTTAKLDALAVTTDKLNANAVTVGKLAAGSVDATALKADAITGKTIAGGTVDGAVITGGIVQTAGSGQRVVLNPAAIDPGNPSVTAPAVELHSGSVAQTAPGILSAQVSDDVSAYPYASLCSPAVANIGPNGQPIISEVRLLSSQPGVRGGSFSVDANANPYNDSTGSSRISGYVGTDDSDTSSLELVCFDGEDAPGGTGLLGPGTSISMTGTELVIRARDNVADKSVHVLPAGVSIDGTLTVGSTPFTTYTPTVANGGTATFAQREGWYYKIGKMVFVQVCIVCSGAGSGTTGITVSLPSTPYRGTADIRQYLPVYAGGIAAGTNSASGGAAIGNINFNGAGAIIDQIRDHADIQIRGNNLGATSAITINGWYREV